VHGVDDDLAAISLLIPRLIGAFLRRLTRRLATYGLTFPQFMALVALEHAEEGRRMGPLAEAAYQSAASMTGIVDRLLERGLVERHRHPDDRRSVVVRLTDLGRELLAHEKQGREQNARRFLLGLSDGERERVRAILERLVGVAESGAD
jgi:DNA-binding MarR family transcriptional regulator